MNDKLTIRTNHHIRLFLYRSEIPNDILKSEFDWLDEDVFDGFIKYRGSYYHTSEFIRFDYPMGIRNEYEYHGYLTTSNTSAIWIKLTDDGKGYSIATVY